MSRVSAQSPATGPSGSACCARATSRPLRCSSGNSAGFGFMGHAQAYRRVLVLATGAGIGPVLLYLLDHHLPGLHCVWIGRDHHATTGADLVDRVLAGGQVTLVDTRDGRPDLADLVTRHGVTSDAVFVVSNALVRDQVAAACNRLGVRWYGPTFDS